MSDKTGIQWTDASWNPVIGCRRVSEGCRNCYAESMAARIVSMSRGRGESSPYEGVVKMGADGNPKPAWNGRAVFLPERLDQPLRWTKPRRVFVNSMSDLFHEDITFEQIAAVFGVMAAAPQHTFQVLTKRPERARAFFDWLDDDSMFNGADHCLMLGAAGYESIDKPLRRVGPTPWPLPNVWLGVSAEDQATADQRIPLLLQCPAAVRFVSAEPLLGPIDFHNEAGVGADYDWLTGENYMPDRDGAPGPCPTLPSLDWIIVGGESGKGSRECDVSWIRSIVEQCRAADVACFVKQLGALPVESDATIRSARTGLRVGTRYHDLDDRKGGNPDEWSEDLRVREFPEVSS